MLLAAFIMRERLHFFIIKDCKKKFSSVLKQMLTRHIWYFTYFFCLASQSCSRDGIFHCTSSTRPPDKWWGKPIGSSQWSTSTWPIRKLLSPPERPQLNWLARNVFQRHGWLQEKIKDVKNTTFSSLNFFKITYQGWWVGLIASD